MGKVLLLLNWQIFIVAITILNFVENHQHHEPDVVHTTLGKIQGNSKEFKTRLGKTIYSFRGIRYGEPPIGNLRFKNPVPIKSWDPKTLDATKEGPACPLPIRVDFEVSEDCLCLNIYTTQNPNHMRRRLPVIIYFHPGGFYGVSGQSYFEGPQYWLDENIILVTVNYRLASLGFLSTGDKNAPGNFGMKDQVIAMRFVKEHIGSFGGDPTQITIAGYSAGAISVGLHLVSPMSQGLFQRVILMSAAPPGTWDYGPDQKDIAIKQAQLLDCPTGNSKKIVECLRTKDAQDISTTFFSFQEFGQDPTLIWRPVLEPEFGGERYLIEDPVKLFKEGKYMKVPMITGVTEHEFSYYAYNVLRNETLLNLWNSNFSYAAPIAFHYERGTPRSNQISQGLREFYLGKEPISDKNIESLGKLYADAVIGFQVYRFTNLIAQTNTEPVYHYEFSYKGRYSFYVDPTTNKTIGAVHHDDTMYLFFIKLSFPYFQPDDPEIAMVEKLTKMWSNFAKLGNPTPAGSSVVWEPYKVQSRKYLNIDKTLKMKSNLYAERYAVWDKLFPV